MTTRDTVCAAFAVAMACALLSAPATGAVPGSLGFQAYLVDEGGNPVDQPVNVQFALYTVETGGSPVWTETQSLLPENGLLSASLGELNGFPPALFNVPLWLGVTVGTDSEMTPRRPLKSGAYAFRAADADTLGGVGPATLDQSGDVAALDTEIDSVSSSVATNTATLVSVQSEVDGYGTDIGALEADLTAVEATLPTLQPLVTGSCPQGSSIQTIASDGSVSCETDDASVWNSVSEGVAYWDGNVGIGDSSPDARLSISAASGVDPLLIRRGGRALSVFENRSVLVGSPGTITTLPDDSLMVYGNVSLGQNYSPVAKLHIQEDDWHMALENFAPGGAGWYVGSSADGWGAGGGKLVFSPTSGSSGAAMVLDGDRNVGIGTVVPETRLHIKGGNDVGTAGGGYLTLGNGTSTNVAIDNNEIMGRNNGAASTLDINREGGQVKINAAGSFDDPALYVRGHVELAGGGTSSIVIDNEVASGYARLRGSSNSVTYLGSADYPFRSTYSAKFYALSPFDYLTYSDLSLKRNVRQIPDALDRVLKLNGVAYELASHPFDGPDADGAPDLPDLDRQQLGFIAQEVESVLPQLVAEDPDSGVKVVGYMGLIPVLVEALKTQQDTIERQNRRIEALEQRMR